MMGLRGGVSELRTRMGGGGRFGTNGNVNGDTNGDATGDAQVNGAFTDVLARTDAIAWTLCSVDFRYAGAVAPTLGNVTLDIRTGRMTALLGPNGAGKSTLLQMILGTSRPNRGQVVFGERPLAEWTSSALAKVIGVVPQHEAEPLFTVREIVAMGRYPHLGPWSREGPHDRAAIQAALERCGVEKFADRWLSTLSGGERQRVRIARALAQEPSVLVLDEPTASLDVRYEMATFELLRELCDDGVTVVLATHNINLAARYADDLVLMQHGCVVANGAAGDVLTAERVGVVYEWPVAVVLHSTGVPQIVPQSTAESRWLKEARA